jgi:hypothetical protein
MNLKKENLKFLGNYRGQVMDVNDPKKLGRVRVMIYDFFSGVETKYLPWAVPVLPLISGSGSEQGWFAVPSVGSWVMCFFEAGDINQPVYFGEAPDGVHGQSAELKKNYPNRRGFKTKNGHVVYFDDKIDEIKIKHNTGAYVKITSTVLEIFKSSATIKIDDSGNITISGTRVDINP